MDRGEIRLGNETVAEFPDYPISRGVPLPPGKITDVDEVSLIDEQGDALPSEATVLQRRPDNSIEWMLVDTITSFAAEQKKKVYITFKPNPHTPVDHPIKVDDAAGTLTVTNGLTELAINKTAGSLIHHLTINGRPLIGAEDLVDLQVVDQNGKVFRASLDARRTVSIEHTNRLRTTVKIEGRHVARDDTVLMDYVLRLTVTADRADVKIVHTFINRQPSEGVTELKAMRMVMPTRMPGDARKLMHQINHGEGCWPRFIEVPENIEIVSSSINEINHYQRDFVPHTAGQIFLRNFDSLREDMSDYPVFMHPTGDYVFRAGYGTGGVRQVFPYLGWQSADTTVVFGMRDWKQLHPKSVAIDENVLTVSIWPEWATPMRTVQGVSKSHTFSITAVPEMLDAKAVEDRALQWEVQLVEPVAISFDPAWARHCQVLDCHHVLEYQPEKYPHLENQLTGVPGEPVRFTYARHDPTGMFNYGDGGGADGYSNNEDDNAVFVPLQTYLRTGRPFGLDYGETSALHYMEVDHCLWSSNPRQNGGLIAHTDDHFMGCVYPSHQWAEGILAYYYLTGDPRAKDVVIRVADNQIFWSENYLEHICCDGREAGMPLVNLAAAHRLTREQKYIDAAKVIIDNFARKWFEQWGDLKYPYPQGAHLKWITGYGDFSTYYGMYRIWETTGDEDVKTLLLALLEKLIDPTRFSVNDSRSMDFQAVWQYIHLTGDKSSIDTLADVIDNFLRKGGHPMRRLAFLGMLDREGNLEGMLKRAGVEIQD
ncbi:MAG: hypothetical protein CMJ49_10460 [Planctomycetaceae bacterium]|nr:hypothetical protein [Planctomycetaceae bacterium]